MDDELNILPISSYIKNLKPNEVKQNYILNKKRKKTMKMLLNN